MNALNRRTQVGRLAVLALAVSCLACAGSARAQEPQGKEYKHGEDHAALLGQLPKARQSLADGIQQVSRPPETAISAKFELDDHGKLSLSVYTAEKGLSIDAEHNVLKEIAGSLEDEKWAPETEVFKDVEHVSRSSQQLTLMSIASVSLIDVVRTAEKEGTLFSITPMLEGGEGRFAVFAVKEGHVLTLEYNLTGQLLEKYEEGKEWHGAAPPTLNPKVIEEASGAKATATSDGIVRIGWSRNDVKVVVDGMTFPPPAGLGSWAGFMATEHGAMVMGDNVVFRDEVDAVIDAAFAHGLEVTALHNHFFYDEPKVYFMHIGGHGQPADLAKGVKAMWDAAKQVRGKSPKPADRFGGPIPEPGERRIDPKRIEQITGLKAAVNPGGVVKVNVGREARMHDAKFGASMGLSTWAAFSGTDELAAMDGDFAMSAEEVTSVLRALRKGDIHVVALHNHMIGETPGYYFVHFWAIGPTKDLAQRFEAALEAQGQSGEHAEEGASMKWTFDDAEVDKLAPGWKAEGTNQRGPVATWLVKADESAPSRPNVLALTDTKESSGSSFNLCWTDRVKFRDGKIEVKIKARTGREDQGGGPIWRVQDKDNYYIARWNPLEDNFRLYYVKDGSRKMLETAIVKADPAKWHTIRIEQKGDEIECYFDGEELLKARDKTFPEAGGMGLWTKADAATSFDDLSVDNAGR